VSGRGTWQSTEWRHAASQAVVAATGADPSGLLGELLLVDTDLATVAAGIAAATRRHVLARLAYLARLKTLDEAEAGRLIAATNAPIAAVDRASTAAYRAQEYTGFPVPGKVAETRTVLHEATTAVAPARERYRQVKAVQHMAVALLELRFGSNVAAFCNLDSAARPWESVAERADEQAAEHAPRHGTPLGGSRLRHDQRAEEDINMTGPTPTTFKVVGTTSTPSLEVTTTPRRPFLGYATHHSLARFLPRLG